MPGIHLVYAERVPVGKNTLGTVQGYESET